MTVIVIGIGNEFRHDDGAGPAVVPWLANTVSESAGQGVDGAWLARTGCLLFGFAVLTTAVTTLWWSVAARVAHAAFGVFGIAVAAYAGRPADPAAAFVASEDLLHSVAATAMGFAFAAGVVLVAARRAHGESGGTWHSTASPSPHRWPFHWPWRCRTTGRGSPSG